MTITSRILRLFKADIHGILDWLEEPEVILKQAIREMEVEIEKDEAALKALLQREEKLKSLGKEKEKLQSELEHKTALSFKQNDEVLAKTFVKRKLDVQKLISALAASLKALDIERDSLEKQLKSRRSELNSIVEKMELFVEKTASAVSVNSAEADSSSSAISDEDVEIAFAEEKRRFFETRP
ncbi:MAG: PspA/IM30 family protein [Deltaproteobacteria bacterium]|nr:PspA/IM30 family protein [Deltaproteobacteria bacterium]